jgi:hypothetical protein
VPQLPPGNFISAPVNRSEIKFTETSVVKPGYIPQQYVPPATYNEYNGLPYVAPGRPQYDFQPPAARGNINLQQIDEQLQMSRKLFPS